MLLSAFSASLWPKSGITLQQLKHGPKRRCDRLPWRRRYDLIRLFGISNCDTVRKARKWLDEHAVDYQFHDYRKEGLLETDLARWCDELGWQSLLNRRSTSWRELPQVVKEDLDGARARDLMLGNPTLIRRPVLELTGVVWVGFTESDYQTLISRRHQR